MSCKRPYELPCEHCRVLFPVECLVDVSDFDPIYRRVCEHCESELVEEFHAPSTCSCSCCDRARARADRIREQAAETASTSHGISPLGMELLGWTEEDL
jgi:hypothetical protein